MAEQKQALTEMEKTRNIINDILEKQFKTDLNKTNVICKICYFPNDKSKVFIFHFNGNKEMLLSLNEFTKDSIKNKLFDSTTFHNVIDSALNNQNYMELMALSKEPVPNSLLPGIVVHHIPERDLITLGIDPKATSLTDNQKTKLQNHMGTSRNILETSATSYCHNFPLSDDQNQKIMDFMKKRKQSQQQEPIPAPKVNKPQNPEPAFAGLTGLRGFFTRSPQQPASSANNSSSSQKHDDQKSSDFNPQPPPGM